MYFWRLISVKRIYFYGNWEIISVRYSNIHRKATYRKQKDVEKISYFPKEILQYINLYFFSEGLLFFFDISKVKCTFSTHLKIKVLMQNLRKYGLFLVLIFWYCTLAHCPIDNCMNNQQCVLYRAFSALWSSMWPL